MNRSPGRSAGVTEPNDESDQLDLDQAIERREPIVLDPRTNEVMGTISSFSWEEYYSGPLPTPQQLDEYNRVSAGLGDRIVTEWQTEGSHRRTLEKSALRGQLRAQSRGQFFAFSLALIIVVGGIVLLFQGKNVGGLVAILAPLATLASVFIYNQRRPDRATQPLAEHDRDHIRRRAQARRELQERGESPG